MSSRKVVIKQMSFFTQTGTLAGYGVTYVRSRDAARADNFASD